MSYRLANMLRALEVEITPLREEFPQGIIDVDLFAALKGRDVTFIAPDRKQLTRDHEAKALIDSGMTALYLAPFWSKLERWPQAIWLVRHWQGIDNFACSTVRGTWAEIKQNGKLMPL
jgi:hypothetical protein